jgi:Ni,Fe-hydrogenase III large subunit/Ni,Fe-hydrogenase III component G
MSKMIIIDKHDIKSDDFINSAENLKTSGKYLLGIAAADERVINSKFSVRYFFGGTGGIEEYCVKTEDSFRSISKICPAAKMYEREIYDLFGLLPEGHPDLRPLMLYPENWDSSIHPLRKDYNGVIPEMKKYGEYKFKEVLGEGIFNVLVGPVHAGIIEPGHFRFSLAGEPVLQLEIRHFWKHRGIEKICEGKDFKETLDIISKISGDNSVNIAISYLEAAESILNIEITERAKYIRVILAELERMWNYVRDVAWIFMDIGFALPAQNLFALQEELMRLNKNLSGHRFLFNSLNVGGVNLDLDSEKLKSIVEAVEKVENIIKESEEFILSSSSVLDRLEFTGKINKKTAEELSLCGISARASELSRDTRAEFPYLIYDKLNMKSVLYDGGDVFARTALRIKEIYLSKKIISNLASNMPEGNICVHCESKPEAYGYAIGNSETSRGNAFFYIMADDKGKIFRLKYIDPSFRIWPSIQYGVLGNIIADFPLINKSLNLSYAGNDM